MINNSMITPPYISLTRLTGANIINPCIPSSAIHYHWKACSTALLSQKNYLINH